MMPRGHTSAKTNPCSTNYSKTCVRPSLAAACQQRPPVARSSMSLEKKPQKVSIEFGHTYTDSGLVQSGESMHRGIRELQRELTAFEMRCKENGNAAVEIARQLELTAKTHVLLDDVEWSYEQSRSHGNTDRIALFRARSLQGAEIAFSPDSAQSEGSLGPQAKARAILLT